MHPKIYEFRRDLEYEEKMRDIEFFYEQECEDLEELLSDLRIKCLQYDHDFDHIVDLIKDCV